jgi:3'-phosphoadenosine 5'-phosphosulfate sulfotransferase (PAPS reductase)/FAD synthetase
MKRNYAKEMRIGDKKIIASVSGGKDSTAMALHLKEQGYTFQPVFLDTGWEAQQTYDYIFGPLQDAIGEITRVIPDMTVKEEDRCTVEELESILGFESAFIRRCVRVGYFPRRNMRFCTTKLKLDPMKKFLSALEDEPVDCVGIRKEEGGKRAEMEEFEWMDFFDCLVWRPIINWSEEQVIETHHRNNLLPNPLYLQRSDRVGCWPCIYSRKSEIETISMMDSKRIDVIRAMERLLPLLGKTRNESLSFFNAPIDITVEWSRTSRGGKQYKLFDQLPGDRGCMKWGLCNT